MEDILASIRRILNEGEGEAAGATAAEAAPPAEAAATPATEPVAAAPEPAPAAGEPPANETDVLILDPAMMVTDTATTDAPAEATLASTETVAAASQSVGALKKALSERHAQVYKGPAVSLEEIVREEVRPVLKDWLNAHLPSIVERLVRTEIERVVARELT